jgi:hypothetical protein
MYDSGEGVPQDHVEAVRWFRKAAEQGDVKAQCYLGYAYRWGEGVPQSYADAVRWYRKAAEQGDAVAQGVLADAYWHGQWVQRSCVQATYWFLKVVQHCTRLSMQHAGWTTLIAVLLMLTVFVPRRRWGRAKWLSSALLSAGAATYVLHLALASRCGWPLRAFGIVFFATVFVAYAYAAVAEAVRGRKLGADAGEPPTIPAGTATA